MDQLTEEDRAVVCRPGPPATRHAAWLATELLPRGCYIDFGDATIRTAICACVCALSVATGPATAECGGS